MQPDPFKNSSDSLLTPAKTAFAIIPNDTTDLPTATKAVYVGSGGAVTLRAVDADADVTFTNVPSGSILPVRVQAVRESSTASDLVGLA
ncbi:hypothetical protein FGU71_07150 [Erythrobacter insulae]|uniref:Uncharacterized protein n=1 Tax=Erythrobacter insulae TaxID=2584124 RepID=A0A547PC11_9SPHN|nr:hypothetical protein [Erythrobacter insulae]TRD11665.1 hypothetical protein FGU71_07150 [Erythrobacter insulae]